MYSINSIKKKDLKQKKHRIPSKNAGDHIIYVHFYISFLPLFSLVKRY